MAKRPSIKGAGADIFFSDEDKQDAQSSVSAPEKKQNEPKVKITVRVPQSLARLIDEVYGRKKVLGEAATKDQIVTDILQPALEADCQRLRDAERKRLLGE